MAITHDPEIEAIRRRLDAATAVPWSSSPTPVTDVVRAGAWPIAMVGVSPEHLSTSYEDDCLVATWGSPSTRQDAELIAHAPTDISYLLAEVERLTDALTELDGALEMGDTHTARTIIEDNL